MTNQESTLAALNFCREKQLNLEMYHQLLTQKEGDSVIEPYLSRMDLTYLSKKFSWEHSLGTSRTSWVPALMELRMRIDRAEFQQGLEVAAVLLRDFDLPDEVTCWVYYLKAKCQQHSGNISHARYLLLQVLHQNHGDQILALYVYLDLAMIYYNEGRHFESQNTMTCLAQSLEGVRKWEEPQFKVACGLGLMYFAYGEFLKAEVLLKKISDGKSVDLLYTKRAKLYLFQLYIESRRKSDAEKLLAECIREFYETRSEYRGLFLRFWLEFLIHLENQPLDSRLVKEIIHSAKNTPDYANWASYRVDLYLASRKEYQLKDVLVISKQCRSAGDEYSRFYLWSEVLRNSPLFLAKNKGARTQLLLKFCQSYFEKNQIQTGILRIRSMNLSGKYSTEFIENCVSLGHRYLLEENVIYFSPTNNRAWNRLKGEILLGKDRTSLPILAELKKSEWGTLTIEEVLQKVYEERILNFHSLKKLQTAIHRLNQRFGAKIVHYRNGEIVISAGIKLVLVRASSYTASF